MTHTAALASAGALQLPACSGGEPEGSLAESSLPLVTFWEDDWARSDVDVGGACTSGAECSATFTGFTCDDVNHRWLTNASSLALGECTVAGPNSCLATEPSANLLYFHGEDRWPTGGWEGLPLYSQQIFDKDGYISVEVTARAYCGPDPAADACFAGVVLYNGESNYRQIAYVGDGGAMKLWRYAGGSCDPSELLSVTPNTWHKLRLDYFGGDGGKWVYYVDDIVRAIEAPGLPGALLLDDPRVAFIFVGGSDGKYVEGALQPVRVWTGDNETQSQSSRVDGYGITNTIWYAQEILSPGANVARARLFFGPAGQQVVVSAFTDNGGKPGVLINETSYTTDRAGEQDVPVWVPGSYPKIWLVVRGQTSAMADIGTSAPGSNPYSGRLLVSGNAGATWSTATRDLFFTLYTR
ncbi:hypothetical protein WME79_02020 [Sorangium sp. So ce726]|uniref:hypothetical protein n=1 Tax=Sorangium sp. So ce726 TaxID=3133319 RepID=UPI003F642827